VALLIEPESNTSKPPNLAPGFEVLTVIILSAILSCDDVTYNIEEEPNTVKSFVTINEPDIVSLPTTVSNEPSNLRLLSTVAFGEEPLSVKIPLSCVPVIVTVPLDPLEPDVPLVPLEPEEPDVPLDPLDPDVPLEPEEPDVPEVPLVPELPEEPEVPLEPELPLVPLEPDVPELPEDPDVPEVPLVPKEP